MTSYVKIYEGMVNKFSNILKKIQKNEEKYKKEDFLTRLGREQLTKINDRGLDLPIALL